MTQLSIGAVAKLTGLTTKTIRFYEDAGIITKAKRSDNGYRIYSRSTVDELNIIKYARDLDLPLSEIKKLMLGCQDGQCHHSKDYLEQFLTNYLTLIDQKTLDLNRLKDKLTTFQTHLHSQQINCAGDQYCCNIFHQVINYLKQEGGETHARH